MRFYRFADALILLVIRCTRTEFASYILIKKNGDVNRKSEFHSLFACFNHKMALFYGVIYYLNGINAPMKCAEALQRLGCSTLEV